MNQRIPWICWRDFKELNLTHGTIRNNLFKLKEMGFIEYSHKSKDAYYTLPKDSLQNVMTVDHLWVTKPQLASLIKRLAFDTPAVHNIRLVFYCPTIYQTILKLGVMKTITPISEDLPLPREILENGALEVGIITHRTDYVTVSLACSAHPIHLDIPGLVRLTSCLTRIEERVLRSKLLNLVDIPYYGTWTVTMWHIGIDSKERYTGPAYEETWENFTGEMYRIYSKSIEGDKKKRVLRLERQEYPNNPVHDTVEEKLSRVLGSGVGGGDGEYNRGGE
jgi:hypothetical protein